MLGRAIKARAAAAGTQEAEKVKTGVEALASGAVTPSGSDPLMVPPDPMDFAKAFGNSLTVDKITVGKQLSSGGPLKKDA